MDEDLFGRPHTKQNPSSGRHTKEEPGRRPLADRLRPATLDDVVGQDHLLGERGVLRRMLQRKSLGSLILWGEAGVGKTTIARLLARGVDLHFAQISAVFSGVSDLKRAFDEAGARRGMDGRGTLLFVDEIHRFNRSQQDSFLPFVEDGTVTLVGATTENPSFALNSALLSRCQVLALKRLDDESLELLLNRAEHELGRVLPLTPQARQSLRLMADGDGRHLLNMAEQLFAEETTKKLTAEDLSALLTRRAAVYDKDRDGHYNLISALHKSIRGSDPDAALYWFSRMLEGGEDPRYLARRLMRIAVEDVGLAAPQALSQASAAWGAYERLGSPEGELALAQLVVYLAISPKSNAVYKGYNQARQLARKTGSLMPPPHILNAPTQMMKDMGYGQGYECDHDMQGGVSGQDYFPEGMVRPSLYQPTKNGSEKEIGRRMSEILKIRESRRK